MQWLIFSRVCVLFCLLIAAQSGAQSVHGVAPQPPAARPMDTAAKPAAKAETVADVAKPTSTVAAAPRSIDAADLSAFVDGLVQAGMARDGIAGVTVAVVDRQGSLLLRGYGIAAQSPNRPVVPERTLFRIGSVSKTFTYLLGLHLVDSGRLKLDAPVNDYLPAALKLPDDSFAPVLVRHLFTHTAGYEDSAMGHLFTDRADRALGIEAYLAEHRPQRVREPGVHAVYSNYSVALLGAIVARVEGVDFETLAERRLFAPMDMSLTTFREPLSAKDPRRAPARFDDLWSEGFQRSGGGFKPEKFEFIAQIAPAGSASSNAADMARYLRMLINGGALDGVQVLSGTEYARLTCEPLFRNEPDGTGFSYGFFKRRYGRVESLEHGGATSWFHTHFVAVPSLGVGIFVSTNTDTARRFAAELPEKILVRYFAQARPLPLPAPAERFDGSRFVGSYFSERGNYTRAEKIILDTPATIAAGARGELVLSANGDASRWLPEGGLRFREAEGQRRITFFVDKAGRITGFAGAAGHTVFARAGFFDDQNVVLIMLGLALAASLLVLVAAWLRRGRKPRDAPKARRDARWLTIAALVWIVFIAVFASAALGLVSDAAEAFYRYPDLWLTVALWLSPLAMLITLTCLWRLPAVWRTRDWKIWRKLRHAAVVVIYLLASWTLWHWNLVGWKL